MYECTGIISPFKIRQRQIPMYYITLTLIKSIKHKQKMINFFSASPNQKLSLELIKMQRYSINLPIIRKMSNNERNKGNILKLKMTEICSQKQGQIGIKRNRKQIILNKQLLQKTKMADNDDQEIFENNSKMGFQQQFIAEVKKLSNMILIYDLNKKNKFRSIHKKHKTNIEDQSQIQFNPKSKRRYKTIDDYCQNLPLKYSVGEEVAAQQQTKQKKYQLETLQTNKIREFKRYIKLSKLKDIKVELYKDEIRRNQIEDENILISKSKSEGRSQIPTPSNIIIQNLRNYIKKKNQKFMPIPQSGLLKNYYKRNKKLFFNKNYIPIHNSLNEDSRKIQLSCVNNILKCYSIPKQQNGNFGQVEVQRPQNFCEGQSNQLTQQQIFLVSKNEYQCSNLIKKRNGKKYYTMESINSRNGRNSGKRQSFATSRVENQEKMFFLKNEQIRPRNFTFDEDQQRRHRLKKQLSKQIIIENQQYLPIKQKQIGLFNRYKSKDKKCTEKQQESEQKKKKNKDQDQDNKLMLAQSINQWPFQSTSSEHFNQYFFSQKQQPNR